MKWFVQFLSVLAWCMFATTPNYAAPVPLPDRVLVTVNGDQIKESRLAAFKRNRPDIAEKGDDILVKELIGVELLAQHARQIGLDKKPDVIADIEGQIRGILANAAMQEILAKNPVTDSEVRADFDKRIQLWPKQQFKLKLLSTETESDAKRFIGELDKGAKFLDLAKDPANRAQQVDLAWITREAMPAPVAAVVPSMHKGTYTKTPVKTDATWHIILFEDVRDNTPPPAYESVSNQIRANLQSARVNAFIDQLNKKAKIQVNN